MARRQHLTLMLAIGLAIFFSLAYFLSTSSSAPTDPFSPVYDRTQDSFNQKSSTLTGAVDLSGLNDVLSGGSIMPKLGNETLKAELGRATWKFLHTMVARFPEEPSEEQQAALKKFFTLFSFLYPCGECAEHFRQLLAKYPPQVSSRNAAAGWLCYAHNIVNKRLKKPDFDCTKIGDFYDCGCADDPGKAKPKPAEIEGELKE